MRRSSAAAFVLGVMLLPTMASAQGRAQFGAFGGLTFGDTASAGTFGGNIGAPLGSHLQIVAEAGRLDDVMPSTVDSILALTSADVRVSALYGEAGLRWLASDRAAVTPYAEATAGIARLRSGFTGAGRADPFINTALWFFDRNEPLLGVGGGVIVRGGPLVLDVGYRYKKILSDSWQAALHGGDGIQVSQARIGIGVRF
jgi:hypothetical protein